jgi:hypothetical protein
LDLGVRRGEALLATPGEPAGGSPSRVEDEDEYREASCMKSGANQIKSDRPLYKSL